MPPLATLTPLLEPGDIVIDGGNSYYRDDIRRGARAADGEGLHYVDVGTSGGVWRLRARLLPDDRRRAETSCSASTPIFATLAPGARRHPPTPGRGQPARHGRAGLSALRPARRRPLRQDGAQRHRVRPHGRLRRGPRTSCAHANVGKQHARHRRARRRRCATPSTTSTTSTCADITEVWRRGSVIALVAARSRHRHRAFTADPDLSNFQGRVS